MSTRLSKGNTFSSYSDKAEILNLFSSECFNSCSPPIVSCPFTFPSCLSPCSPHSFCTESEVFGLISRLPSSTTSGPDSISSQMLKSTCISIVAPLIPLFNLSLSQGHVPADWKITLLFPSLSVHLTWIIPQITDPLPYSLSLASYLKNICSLSPLQIRS